MISSRSPADRPEPANRTARPARAARRSAGVFGRGRVSGTRGGGVPGVPGVRDIVALRDEADRRDQAGAGGIAVAEMPACVPLRIRRLHAGERWRAHYDGTVCGAGERRFDLRPGYSVLGAYRGGRLVGCAEFTVCDLDGLLGACEYHNANPSNGPFFHAPSETEQQFVLLHSLWVDPSQRGAGIGGALCERLAAHGLATYAEFAREWVCDWFHRRYSPAVRHRARNGHGSRPRARGALANPQTAPRDPSLRAAAS
jgi:GNAT superfamily N-acetyltransferase